MDPPVSLHVCSCHGPQLESLHVCSFHKPHITSVIACVFFPQTTHGSTSVIACVSFSQTTYGFTSVIACVFFPQTCNTPSTPGPGGCHSWQLNRISRLAPQTNTSLFCALFFLTRAHPVTHFPVGHPSYNC